MNMSYSYLPILTVLYDMLEHPMLGTWYSRVFFSRYGMRYAHSVASRFPSPRPLFLGTGVLPALVALPP